MPTTFPSTSGCAGCSEHRAQSLVRLGLSPDRWDHLVALAGNPNTGKSTVFNALTGLRQHTGNWPGKTVVRAEGVFLYEGERMKVVDLPGTYSLQAGSAEFFAPEIRISPESGPPPEINNLSMQDP